MEKRLSFKQILIIVCVAVVLYVGLMNFGAVSNTFKAALNTVSPLVYGGVAAIVLNVIMCGFEKLLRKIFKKKTPKDSLLSAISLILSIIVVMVFIAIVILLIVPQFASAVPRIKSSIEANWSTITEFASKLGVEIGTLQSVLAKFDASFFTQKLVPGISQIFTTVLGAASAITGGVFMTLVSIVACIYILVGKKKLSRQLKNVLYAYVNRNVSDKIIYFFKTLNDTFKRFLSSQCLDALILGVLLLIVMLIFRLPYAGVISAITVIFALIPYFGAFISCGIGALLIALIAPKSALVFVVLFLVVQQIEGNLIYPKIVGRSVGLPALWTLLAVYVGGELFGVIGMILFIPVVSVIYTLLGADVAKRNKKEKAVTEEK